MYWKISATIKSILSEYKHMHSRVVWFEDQQFKNIFTYIASLKDSLTVMSTISEEEEQGG